MTRIALLALLALAPLAQAGTVFAGRDLTPPADFIMPASGQIGVWVQPTAQAGKTNFGGRDLTPSAGFITPSSGAVGTRVLPNTADPVVEDAGTSFTYGDDE